MLIVLMIPAVLAKSLVGKAFQVFCPVLEGQSHFSVVAFQYRYLLPALSGAFGSQSGQAMSAARPLWHVIYRVGSEGCG